MYSDLNGYVPENVEYVLPDYVKDLFPAELDFSTAGEGKKFKNSAEILKFMATISLPRSRAERQSCESWMTSRFQTSARNTV